MSLLYVRVIKFFSSAYFDICSLIVHMQPCSTSYHCFTCLGFASFDAHDDGVSFLGRDRRELHLHDKVFGAAEASEKRFRRRREAAEQAERVQSVQVVERKAGVLRDAQCVPFRSSSVLFCSVV